MVTHLSNFLFGCLDGYVQLLVMYVYYFVYVYYS